MTGLVLLFLRLVLLIALYTFLALAFVTLWRELRNQSRWFATRRIPPITLALQANGEREATHFARPQVTIGRNPTCDWMIDEETVSSLHARLTFRNDQWWVDDLDSTNGTYLNGQRVNTLIVLTSGDHLRLGQVEMTVSINEQPPAV